MNKDQVKSGLSKIWALVYRSTQVRLSPKQEEELRNAISETRANLDMSEVLSRKVEFACDLASMHLSALTALSPRKPSGAESLVSECEALLRLLDSN